MGLDIIAYRKLHPVSKSEVPLDEYGDILDYDRYVNLKSLAQMHEEYWPGRSEPFADADAEFYSFDEEGYMRAGSYSGYNLWRGALQDFAWNDEHPLPDGAFEELIEFSDCEGLIGTPVSEKLYRDFADNRPYLDEFADARFGADTEERDWFVAKYDEWTQMFDLGRDDGAVRFC